MMNWLWGKAISVDVGGLDFVSKIFAIWKSTRSNEFADVLSAASAVCMDLWIVANSRQAQRFHREAFALLKSGDLEHLAGDCLRLSSSVVRFVARSQRSRTSGYDNAKPMMLDKQ